jgi:hypothetical protein
MEVQKRVELRDHHRNQSEVKIKEIRNLNLQKKINLHRLNQNLRSQEVNHWIRGLFPKAMN